MLEHLLTEQTNPESRDIDAQPTETILRVINHADEEVPRSVAIEIPRIAELVEVTVARIRAGGRLFYIGAGTSGRLGVLDAAECAPTFNVPAELVQGIIAGGEKALAHATEASEDDPEAGKRDLAAHGFVTGDVLVGIAASGRTPYVLGAIAAARDMGAVTAGISCTPDSELSRMVDIPITPIPGPEVIAGSTRMRAGTATKLVLNMISTAVMIRLGYVYGNLMVNVQPKNDKLTDRARRIVAEAANLSYGRAGEMLEASGRDVKTAIVMAKLHVSRETAHARLSASGGRLRAALEDRHG